MVSVRISYMDDLEKRVIALEKELALEKQAVAALKEQITNLSSGIGRGLWILGGGFMTSFVAWIAGGGLAK